MAEVVASDGCRTSRPVAVVDRVACLQEVGPRSAPVGNGASEDDYLVQLGSPADVGEHRHVVSVQKVSDGEQDTSQGAIQELGGFPAPKASVDGDKHGSGAVGTQGGYRPLGHVGRPDGDPVARFDPAGHQGPAGGVDLVAVFGERPSEIPVDDCLSVAEPEGGVVDQVGDGGPRRIHQSDPKGRRQTSGHPGWSTTGSPDRTSAWCALAGAPGRPVGSCAVEGGGVVDHQIAGHGVEAN